MILATAAVGKKYVTCIKSQLEIFDQKNIHILTDQVNAFFTNTKVHSFNKRIWSYFDKLLFAFNLAKKYDTDVFYFDANKASMIKPSFLKYFTGSKNICVKGVWEDSTPEWKEIKFKGQYWSPFVNFLKNHNIEPTSCPAYNEQHIYIPKDINLDKVLKDLETVKPVLEYCSIIGENKYSGIGSGEGAGLGYVVIKNKLNVDFFDKKFFSI